MIIFSLFFTFLAAMFLGIPIAVSLLLGGIVPILTLSIYNPTVVIQKFYFSIILYALLAIPLFVVSGGLLDKGGVSRRLVKLADALVGWLPGGLAIVTFLSCAFFGAITGVSSATVIAIGSIMVPSMIKAGYSKAFSLTTVAAGGWLGIIVPPSTPMILYGVSSSTSIGEMFMGGIIPGFLLAAGMSIYSLWYGKKYLPKAEKFKINNVWIAFKDSIFAIMMPLIVLGGIYSGVFTPTEAGAVAVLYGLIIGLFVYKELNLQKIYDILRSAVITSASIMFIIAGASVFGYIMTRAQIPAKVAGFILNVATNQFSFMIMVMILLFIVGTFMETTPAILILTPILSPMLSHYDINPVAFGVTMIVNLGIGMITPPVGMNLYVAAGLMNEKVDLLINKHLFWYVIFALLILVVLVLFPNIITFIPDLLK